MKKVVTLLLLGISPISIIVFQNNSNTSYKLEDANSIIANSPFKEFTYIDKKALKLFKNGSFGNYSDEDDIIGIYIGKHGSLAIIKRKNFIDKYFKKNDDLLMKNINKSDLGNAEVNDLIKLLPKSYKDVLIYYNNSVIGVHYDLGMYKTCIVKIVRKEGDKTNLEKIKNELFKKADVIDCNVEDMGNKVYIYLECNGYISPTDVVKMFS